MSDFYTMTYILFAHVFMCSGREVKLLFILRYKKTSVFSLDLSLNFSLKMNTLKLNESFDSHSRIWGDEFASLSKVTVFFPNLQN